MTTSLDTIEARFAELERRFAALLRGHYGLASTKSMNAGYASTSNCMGLVRLAIDDAKAKRAAWLKVPFGAEPLSARAEHALYAAPETMPRALTTPTTVPPVSLHVKCPQCLRPDAERGDVEAKGACLDCHLAGHGKQSQPAQEPSPREASAFAAAEPHAPGTTSPAAAAAVTSEVSAPPRADQPVVDRGGSSGPNGVRSAYRPEAE